MFLMLLLKDIINKLHLYVVMVEQHVEALLFKEEHDLLVAERAELRTRLVELQQEQVTPETAQLQFRHQERVRQIEQILRRSKQIALRHVVDPQVPPEQR